MYIKSIELDGFKSYAKRQLIQGFHKQFNAITGYNGSGKSNILDGICFLLGLSKLENIRAKNMTDLIFKQGQAGVNKAVVTITFDNSDESKSPIGMKDTKEIIIRRQIVAAGTGRGVSSSYTLNGMPATNNRIHDFFRGIGLNVNNPHFLIMQGRITKVLNMKPEEILGMIEEAAGTKMYDQKRKDTEKTISQKDMKLEECQKIIEESLDPKIEKMREDRKNLIEINRLKKTKEGMQRKLDAYVYWQNLKGENENRKLGEETKAKIEQSRERIEEIEKLIGEKEKMLEDLENHKNDQDSNTELEESLKAKTEERVNKEVERDEIAEHMKQIEEDRKRKKISIEKDQKLLEKKKKEHEKILSDHDSVDKQQKKDQEDAQKYRSEIEALTRGTMADENGEQVSIEQKIQESRTETAELEAAIKTAQNRQTRLRPRIQDLTKNVDRLKKQNTSEMSDIKSRELEVQKATEQLKKLKFDEEHEAQIKDRVQILQRETQDLDQRCQKLIRTAHKGRYDFVFRDPPIPNFDRARDVRGTVATLFKVKPSEEKYNFAVEIACGNFLQQVVVSNQNIARSMVEHRVFVNRKTLMPIAETRKKSPHWQARLESNRFQHAKQIADKHKEEVKHMIDLIDFPPELTIIMENLFGSILVTTSLTCAKEIAYHPKIRTRVVTERVSTN
ncbi:unnamed protein product [Caenorhabditis angaria]|uniref:SMC hinge domain-containing protein n=1 Tax=Caenorhabditis angaria TaxID=860376 RepID=A0A9P1MY25_9PELO|nr:unnamed protein product [Caenorhabditis angaria]